jgi:hypothetical protein
VAITLGKDATLTVGGGITSVRNVQWSASAVTIDVEPYGSRLRPVYSVGWAGSVSFEINDDSDLDIDLLVNGTEVAVSGGEGGWSFEAVVTGISEMNPLDGVTTFQVECQLTQEGLRT